MLNRHIALESPLGQEELLARLAANVKPVPGYATWWTWPRDKALWGSASSHEFQVQLGRARQLVSARGRIQGQQQGSRVSVSLGFKGWVIPYLVASAAALVLVGALLSVYFRDGSLPVVVTTVAVLSVALNVGVGLMQQRDLVRALNGILDSIQRSA
jgi:hypothetical protein